MKRIGWSRELYFTVKGTVDKYVSIESRVRARHFVALYLYCATAEAQMSAFLYKCEDRTRPSRLKRTSSNPCFLHFDLAHVIASLCESNLLTAREAPYVLTLQRPRLGKTN